MVYSALFFSLMDICVKFASRLPTVEIVFFRGLIAITICVSYFYLKKINPWGTHKPQLIARGIFGTIALLLYYHSISIMPLAAAVTIQKLSPIFTVLFAALFMKRMIPFRQIILFIIAFTGIWIMRGSLIELNSFALSLAVFSAIFAGLGYATIANIGLKENPFVIIFYFPLVSLPFVSIPTFQQFITPTSVEWLALLGVGISVHLGQYFMTLSLQHGETNKVTVYFYIGPIFAVISGYLLFNEVLNFQTFIGILVILLATTLNSLKKSVR